MQHKKLYKNIFWQYLLQGCRYLAPLIVLPFLTRILQPEGYAVYSYILCICATLATLIDFGINLYGTRKIIALKDNILESTRFVSNTYFFKSLVAIVAICGALLFARSTDLLHNHIDLVLIVALTYTLKSLLPDYLFQAHEEMSNLTTRYIVCQCLVIVLIFLFVRQKEDLLLLTLIELFGALVAFFWTLVNIKRKYGIGLICPQIKSLPRIFQESGMYCLSNVSSMLFSGFSTLAIGILLTDKAEIAYWSVGLTAIAAIQSLYTPLTNSLYPHMIRTPDWKFAKKIILIPIPAILFVMGCFIFLSDFIMTVIAGDEYRNGGAVLAWLSPVLLFSYIAMMIGWPVIGALGEVKKLTYTTVISGIVNIFFIFIIFLTDQAFLLYFCISRCLTESVLMLTRIFVLYSYIKKH